MSNPEDESSDTPQEPPDRLGRRFLVGTFQLGVGTTAAALANVAIGILLARILGPEEFGLFAFAFVICELIGIVGAFSLGNALIQSRDESPELYDTALVMSLGLAIISLLIAAAIAPFLFRARGSEAMQFLLILTAGRSLVLLAQVPRAKLERSLRYGRVTTLTMLETTLPNVIALGLAWLGWGAWALVARDLLVSALTLSLETWSSGYRFRASLSRPAAEQLMTFARPMFVSRAIEILVMRSDKLAVGAFLGNVAIGLIDRARFVADIGLFVMRPVERASLNLFSRVQDDLTRLSRAYEIVNYFLVRAMFAGGCVLLLTPSETLELLFGKEWVGAAPALRWLAVHAAVFPVFSMIKVLVIARNRVVRLARISAIQAALLIPGTLIAAWLGSFEGVAVVVALTTLSGTALGILWSRDLASVSYRQLFGVPLAAGVLSAGMLFAIVLTDANQFVPPLARPFAVGGAFVALVLAMEPRRIRRELGYLRTQLALDDSAKPAS